MGVKPAPSERKTVHGPEERIKMTRLRLTIAKTQGGSRKRCNAHDV